MMGSAQDTDVTQRRRRLLELAEGFAAFGDLAADDRRNRQTRVRSIVGPLQTNAFRLVVLGEIKRGKSSFINALLGSADLVPVDGDVATSTVYKIVYGAVEKYTVFFRADDDADDDSAAPAPLEIPKERVREFGTEDGNPDNVKRVHFIAIEFPHPLLQEGIVLVDTPGVGGLFKKHRDITFEYVPNADAVLFLFDSVESVVTADEKRFLEELRESSRRIAFLQTKLDLADSRQTQEWRKRNLDELSKIFDMAPERIPYFSVSSKLKQAADRHQSAEDLEDSGYLPVLRYLRQVLLPARDLILIDRTAKQLATEVAAAGQTTADRRALVAESNKPKLKEYEARLGEAEREFETWQTEKWPRAMKSFQDETGRIKRDARNRLHDALAPDSAAQQAMVAQSKQNIDSMQKLSEVGDELLSSHAAYCNRAAEALLTEVREAYACEFRRVAGAAADDLKNLLPPSLSIEPGALAADRTHVVNIAREAIMTGGALGGVAKETAGLVGAGSWLLVKFGWLALPAATVVVGGAFLTYVGVRIWSTRKGVQLARERQLQTMLDNLGIGMAKTARSALVAAGRAMEDMLAEMECSARDAFESLRNEIRAEFAARRKDVAAARSRTEDEAKSLVAQLSAELKFYSDTIKELQQLVGSD